MDVRCGPFPALERAFLARLRELKAEPLAPVLVVAPSGRLSSRLQRLAAAELGALLETPFLTFHGLAARLVGAAGGPEKPLRRDPLFYDKLVDRLLRAGGGFAGGSRGLSAALRASIKDLQDAGVEPAQVLEQYREGLFGEPAAQPELGRLLKLYLAYEEALRALPSLSPAALTRRAVLEAPGSPWLGRFKETLYYGFYDLTGLQTDFFQAVARHHPTTVFFPHRPKDPAYRFAVRFFEAQLHGSGKPRPVEAEPAAPSVEAFHASGHADELWKAAKRILRLREEGFAFGEIGVAARTLEPYRPHLEEVFGEHRIPFHTSAEEPLLRHPAAQQVLSLLTWAARDFPAVGMLSLLGSPYYRDSGDAERALVERLRIHQGWLQWEGKLGAAAREEGGERAAALLRSLKALREELETEGGGWAERARRARSLAESRLDLDAAPRAVRAEIRTLFERLASFDELGPPADGEEFLETLEEAFRRSSLPLSAAPNDGVRVLDAMAARGEGFRALIVLGLKEKLFPRLVREDPFLRDRHRAALRDHAGHWISTKLGGYDEEKLLFRLLVEAASERLILGRPRSDEEGKAQSPSVYLLELLRERPHASEAVPLRPAAKAASERERLTPREASLYAALCGEDGRELARRRGWDEAARAGTERAARAVRGFGAPGPWDGLVGPSAGLERRLLERGLSPSAVEDYAACPFRFFASRVLGAAEPERPQERRALASDELGTLYHGFLERLYRDWEPGGFPEERFREALAELLPEDAWKRLGLYPLLWKALRERMEARLRAFAAEDLALLESEGGRPAHLERELEGRLPVALPAGLEGLRFRGRADRLDVVDGALRVVDYKTRLGRRGRLLTRLARAQALQLAFYLELGSAELGLAPGPAELAGIEDARRERLTPGEWASVSPTVWAHLSRMLESMREGRFFVRPDLHCEWCAFARLCRKSHGPSLARSRRAPGWAEHEGMATGRAVGAPEDA